MWKPKRALPPSSSSSGQPSQPKRLCVPPIDRAWNGSEMNPVPSCCLTCCLTKEDLRNMFREELERAKSDWAKYFQRNAVEEIVQEMHSMENASKKLKEKVEPANIHSFHLRRANAVAKNEARSLQLQVQTKLSLPLFTGKKLEGEGGASIYVALIDAKTGGVVTSGPESSIKLDVIVLEGDFNKDDEENWTQEEFENYMVKKREGKRPLLTGNLQVMLKEGVGQLGELIFTDNSSWNRSKSFRIGLLVASGYCCNTRIQEGITDAFPVKEQRGESYRKHHPPASDDEVWRLEKIAKDGKSHQKLSEAGINRVEDFLLQLFTDSQKLREILGKSVIPKNWDILVDHAKTCKTNWKLYSSYFDGMRKHGAVFNTNGQLVGLIKDRVSFATQRLSAQEKEHGDAIVMKALANWNDVREFNGETFSDSMQKNSSSSYSSSVLGGQTENRNHVQRYLAPPIVAAPVGPEAPLANAGSAAEGLNGAMALALPVQSQNTNSGTSMKILVDENFRLAAHQLMAAGCSNVQIPPRYHDSTTAGLPTQSHGLNLQNSMHSKMIGSSSGMDYTGYDDVFPEGIHVRENNTPCNDPFSRTLAPPKGNDVMEDIQSSHSDDSWKQWLADNPLLDNGYVGENNTPCNDPFSRTLAPPEGNGVMEDIQSNHSDDSWKQWSADNPLLDNGYVGGTGRGVIGWLKIKAVLQWGFFIRKRGVRLVELDQPPIQVQACS